MNLHTTYLSILAFVLGVEYYLGKREKGVRSIVELLLTGVILVIAWVVLLKQEKKK